MQRKDEHLTKTQLKERGWSDSLIAKLLGPPDTTRPNPMYRSAGAPMQLWLQNRVESAETDCRFVAYQTDRARRSIAAQQSAEKRRLELLHEIDKLDVHVEHHPISEIMDISLQDWRSNQNERGKYGADGKSAPLHHRQRWAVNFIRHNLTEYDSQLDEVAGRAGVNEAVDKIRARVLDKIADIYPELAHECHRQKRERHTDGREKRG